MVQEKQVAKVVWIVGSGFSAGLGGPLLKDLLHPRSGKDYKASFHLTSTHEAVLRIFRAHHPEHKKEERTPGPTLWQHAEEFLDFVDCARVADSIHAARFKAHFGDFSPVDAHRAACQLVAAECLFTDLRSDLKGEAWQPYIRWARWLTENDTVVTFNYDRVLELLATSEWIKNDCEIRAHKACLTTESFLIPGVQEPAEGLAKVYKLHGSVDWLGLAEQVSVRSAADIIREDRMPFIATPGPTKDLHSNGLLAPSWDRALGAIREASVLIFLGYRFPPSDSESRRKLLAAIDDAQSRHLRVQTVLGPRKNEDDTVRLQSLLETMLTARRKEFEYLQRSAHPSVYPHSPFADTASPNYHLHTHPLYVQDFFTVLHNDLVIGPHMRRTKP